MQLNTKKDYFIDFLGKYEKVIECYNGALQLSPDLIDAYINKGFALRKLGEYQQDIKCFNETKAINLKYKENTWSEKGNNLTMLGEYKEAIECCDDSGKSPNGSYTWKEKGDCLAKLGLEKTARERFDKAKELELSQTS